MKIAKIDNSNCFRAENKMLTKVILGTLNDNSTAIVNIKMDANNNIKFLERYCFKDGRLIEGKGIGNTKGLKEDEIIGFIDDIQSAVKSGCNFFKEFSKAMLRK